MRLILTCILLLVSVLAASAQAPGPIVSNIEISGYHKMNKAFLLNRLRTKVNESTSKEQLTQDLRRLNRLNGIQYSVVDVDTLQDGTLNLEFDIIDQKSIKPYFGLGRSKGNFWYQIGAAEYNLLNKNQTLLGFFASQDGRPNGKLYYENSYFNGRDWGFSISAFHNASIEPLYFKTGSAQYKYDFSGVGLTGFNHFGFLDKLVYNLTLFTEKYVRQPGAEEVLEGPAFLSLKKVLISVGYIHDKVEYDFFYRKGYQHQLFAQSVTTVDEDLRFLSLGYTGKYYWRLGYETNIAAQLRMDISTNNDTPFAPYVLDSQTNLRGVGNRTDRATAQFILNLELRQTVFDYCGVAVQLVAFSDTGSLRPPGDELDFFFQKQNFRSFAGGGVRIILTRVFDSVLRVDYGVDLFDKNTRGLVLGFGQFF